MGNSTYFFFSASHHLGFQYACNLFLTFRFFNIHSLPAYFTFVPTRYPALDILLALGRVTFFFFDLE